MNIPHMVSIIQIYIHHVKGEDVKITPVMPRDMALLLTAYTIANDWVKQNIKTIIILK